MTHIPTKCHKILTFLSQNPSKAQPYIIVHRKYTRQDKQDMAAALQLRLSEKYFSLTLC